MLNASLYITNRPDVVQNAVYQNCKVVAMVENLEELNFNVDATHVTVGSILLPPYLAVSAEVDGNMEMFYALYNQHLAGKEPDCFINCIIAAMTRGFNIIIYVPREQSEMPFVSAFMQYIYSAYGITIGTENNEFQYVNNDAFNYLVCTRLYIHDLISYQEYLVNHPASIDIDRAIIPKLINEMGMAVSRFDTEEEYFRYFNFYKNSIKESGNTFLVPLIVKGRK